LDLIDKRIKDFYGPLYISTETSRIAYETLLEKIGRHDSLESNDPHCNLPKDQELAEWRIWSKSVFMPLNESIERLILKNAYLIREEEIPQCLIEFATHVSAYKAILEKWNSGDLSEHYPALDFPTELHKYAAEAYRELKTEQLRLIGHSKLKARKRK
jgi:hypothetical protein